MKIQGDYLFEAPVDEVWKALLDPVVLAAVMPGCEKLELEGDTYVGELNIKVGPVQGKFSGRVDLKDIVAPTGYTMNIDGRGAPGFVKATATVKLAAEGEHCRMAYDADAQVGGKIASVGQRLLEASSRAIAKQSLEGLHENIKIRAAASQAARDAAKAAEAAAHPAPSEAANPGVDVPTAGEVGPKPEATETTAGAKPATTPAAQAAETPAAKPTAIVPAPPPVVLKRVDQNALAASIAKEVSKELLPPPVVFILGLAVGALVMWLLMRH